MPYLPIADRGIIAKLDALDFRAIVMVVVPRASGEAPFR